MTVLDAFSRKGDSPSMAADAELGRQPAVEVGSAKIATAIHHPSLSYRLGLASMSPSDLFEIENPKSYRSWLRQPGERLLLAFSSTPEQWELVAFAVDHSQARVVSLLPTPDLNSYIRALVAGANGVTQADQHPSSIWRAVETTLSGEVALPSEAARELAYECFRVSREQCPLSEDEVELLSLYALGGTINEIAGSVHYGPRSVRRKLESIYRKLGATTRAHAVHMATRSGWVRGMNDAPPRAGPAGSTW